MGSVITRLHGSPITVGRGGNLRAAVSGLPPCPIYVCTQTAALPTVIAAAPRARRDDLFFLQASRLLTTRTLE